LDGQALGLLALGLLAFAASIYALRLRALTARAHRTVKTLEQDIALAHQKSAWLQEHVTTYEQRHSALQTSLNQAQAEAARLQAQVEERDKRFLVQQQAIDDNQRTLKLTFENISQQLLKAQEQSLSAHNQSSLKQMLQPLAQQIQGFQSHVTQVHGDFLQSTAALNQQINSIKEIGMQVGADATALAAALKGDKKLVGTWGELQVERALESAGLQKGVHYGSQENYKNADGKRFQPDFLIYLPENKHLVIDSKVSLVDYDKALAADNDEDRQAALDNLVTAIRRHIESLSAKDYANLYSINSPDFVLMFMPIEPTYVEVIRQYPDIVDYGFEKNVVLTSYSNLMPILRTVANLWMIDHSNNEARRIAAQAGDIFNAVCVVAERLEQLGGSLQATSNHYNRTVTALVGRQGLHGKVEHLKNVSQRANKTFPAGLNSLQNDIQTDRLTALTGNTETDDGE
jgi:DNA recombination protein RmuC